jgi:hypothetical protein
MDFKQLLLPSRPQTKDKWWHRLFHVLLFGTGLMLYLVTLLGLIGSYLDKFIIYKPTAFALENSYDKARGEVFSCDLDLDRAELYEGKSFRDIPRIISCSGVEVSREEGLRYGVLYETERRKLYDDFGLNEQGDDCPTIRNSSGELSKETINCTRKAYSEEMADPAYQRYENALESIKHIKAVKSLNVEALALLVFVPFLALFAWLLFWSAIIYRSILYIVFGKQKPKSSNKIT